MAKKNENNTSNYIECQGKNHKGKSRLIAPQNFYQSNSPMFPNGKVPICKKCLAEMIDYSDMNTIYTVFQSMDIPFFINRWNEMREKNPDNVFGNYVRMANSGLNEFKGARYKDSIFEKSEFRETIEQKDNYSFDEAEKDLLKDFRPTKDMLIRWGTKYSPEQYIKLENFYRDMKIKNTIETPQEEDYLKKLAVISMKMDEELEAGNYSQAKQLGDLFSKYMADSKFRAMDKTEADKTGGIRNFSTIYAEVESDDFIPPWEHYRKIRGLTQDTVDKSIMHMENFTLRLNRAERMTEPPIDTPKITQEDTDVDLGDNNG
ncbi:MAG: hypothetical protein Q8936_19525 [Bacillota bacterium]|nr:hypothetical protein [Bacillota bacterium]